MESKRKARFDDAYNQYHDVMLQVAALYTRNLSAAEDVVQDVFLKYYVFIGHNEVKNLKAWLMVTTRNRAFNYNRKAKHEIPVDIKEEGDRLLGYGESMEEQFFNKICKMETLEYSDTVMDALYEKSSRWYEVVTSVYCMGLTQKDAGECMGITEDAVQGILKRAKNWIENNYREEYDHINRA